MKLTDYLKKINEEVINESDAYDNNRYMMKKYGGQILARPDNSNTKDGKDHVYAPNAQIAKQLYKQGKKVYREESDHEVSMARGELEAIADKATQLAGALQGKSDEGNPLEAWVQSKITKAKDYINSVSDYLTYDPSMKQNEETLEEKFALYALKDFMDTKAPGGKRKKGDRVSGSMTYTQAISKAKQMNVGSSVGADKRVEVKPMKEELEEAKIISDISGVGINVIKKEVIPFNVKVGRVGPGMDSDYEVEFIGSEPNLIKYAKKHLDFDGISFSQLKKHLAMEETEVNEKTYGWTLVSKAKDLAKKFKDNMTKAVDEIEKLEKGLSKNPVVYKELLKYNEEVELDEGKMSKIDALVKQGKSSDEIAKLMNLNVRTVKDILGEEKEEPKEDSKKEENKESEIQSLKGQIAMLKQKLENEKNKAIKPEPNPETGEVPLTIGIAHAVLKKEKEEVKEENLQELSKAERDKRIQRAKDMIKYYDAQKKAALKGPNKALAKKMLKNEIELEEVTQKEIDKFHTDLDNLVHKTFGHSSDEKKKEKMDEKVASSIIKDLQKAYAPMKGKTISPEMANKISKHLDQPSYDLNVLRQLKKADIPFISTIARNKIYKKTGKFEELEESKDMDKHFKTLSNKVQSKVNELLRTGMGYWDAVKKAKRMFNEDRRLYVEGIAGLQKKVDKSGMPYSILKQVYDRGMAAWKSGHRPGASQQQWAFARVNSFITKSSGTWGGADKDLAAKVKGSK